MSVNAVLTERLSRPFKVQPQTLADGDTVLIDARGYWKLTLLAASGATVTVHRATDGKTWTEPTGDENDVTAPAAGEALAIEVDWPFYLVSTSGGAVQWSLV